MNACLQDQNDDGYAEALEQFLFEHMPPKVASLLRDPAWLFDADIFDEQADFALLAIADYIAFCGAAIKRARYRAEVEAERLLKLEFARTIQPRPYQSLTRTK